MRDFRCPRCGQHLAFENSLCLSCGSPVGFSLPDMAFLVIADDSEAGTSGTVDAQERQLCANLHLAQCNWLVEVQPVRQLCASCRLTRTRPRDGDTAALAAFAEAERAKRRLVTELHELRLPVVDRQQDPQFGLAFDLLSSADQKVVTGHDNGIITVDLAEGDDVHREQMRVAMDEPYRTMLGHFRHEIGHYYWDLLVLPSAWLEDFRTLFGDERADYGAALQQHYNQGPPPDWAQRLVSSYASMHPWEDWAETWAHYLHMADSADTAMSFGVDATNVELTSDLFTPEDLWRPEHPEAAKFLDFINSWVRLTNVLNELSRSMGQPDFYPFVLPRTAVGKLQFIHCVVTELRGDGGPSLVTAQDVEAAAEAAAEAQEQGQEQTQVQGQQQSQQQTAEAPAQPAVQSP
jgi:hypothetical protein